MLIIRKAQMDAIHRERLDEFRVWMRAHLRRHFREQMEGRGDAELDSLIDRGIRRAQQHGADQERSFCKYLALVAALGEGFEADPRYPWAARVLADDALADGNTRVEVLALVARSELARSEARAAAGR